MWKVSGSKGSGMAAAAATAGGGRGVDLDKLPLKRVEAMEESGTEHFLVDRGYEEKRLDLIRRVDFSSVMIDNNDNLDQMKKKKKQKQSPGAADDTSSDAGTLSWTSLADNLRVAQQELTIIIDLISTVEANDSVAVAGMQRPKQLPDELLSDTAVAAATKLQRLRNLAKYFKHSSKVLERQVTRETTFYGSLIRIQHNWKVKKQQQQQQQGSEGCFFIDLLDNSFSDHHHRRLAVPTAVRVDHDSDGFLSVQEPTTKSYRYLQLRYLRSHPQSSAGRRGVARTERPNKRFMTYDQVDRCIKHAHSQLRAIHQSIFHEQVIDMVSRGTFQPSPGVYVLGLRENLLQLGIHHGLSISISLQPEGENKDIYQVAECSGSIDSTTVDGKNSYSEEEDVLGLPHPSSLEIYLQHIFHRSLFRGKKKNSYGNETRLSTPPVAEPHTLLLSHFCMTIAHRIFSRKVHSELESLVHKVSFLCLLSHPAWYSTTSSWTIVLKVPQSILHPSGIFPLSDSHEHKAQVRAQFHTKVVVNNDQIYVNGEGAPGILGSFRGSSIGISTVNSYGCELEDLSMFLLQQVASQIICWLHKEALEIGMKVNKDLLCLYFELDQADILGLVAHVDPIGKEGCITWWTVLDYSGGQKEKIEGAKDGHDEKRRFLGYLSLEELYSILIGLVELCSSVSGHKSVCTM